MEQRPSVWQIAVGTMIGNVGCLIMWALLSCIFFAVSALAGGGFLNQLLRQLQQQ